eukprot:790106_1
MASNSQQSILIEDIDLSLAAAAAHTPMASVSNKSITSSLLEDVVKDSKPCSISIDYTTDTRYTSRNDSYTFRPYRCCILFILPIIVSIAMIVIDKIETISCSDCGTTFFECDYFYQYTCRLDSIEGCCYDMDQLLFCQTFEYNAQELHYNKLVMKDLRYTIRVCGDISYAVLAGTLLIITIIYVILEKCLKIFIFSSTKQYDNVFLVAWMFVSIVLMVPLYVYWNSAYYKCSNWNKYHTKDDLDILPMSDENTWVMGATLWMCIGAFCQILLIGFCMCIFHKGMPFESKRLS